jgi:hypothetical protein
MMDNTELFPSYTNTLIDPDTNSTYHHDADTDADPDSDFLFDAVPDFYLMRMRIQVIK